MACSRYLKSGYMGVKVGYLGKRGRHVSHPHNVFIPVFSSPAALVLFFSTAKRKEPKESAAFCPTAPRGKRSDLRCFAVRCAASWRCHLSSRLPDDRTLLLHVAMWFYLRHGNHIYGNMKAPSGAERGSPIGHFFARGAFYFASRCAFFLFLWWFW